MKKIALLLMVVFSFGVFAATDISIRSAGSLFFNVDKSLDNSMGYATAREWIVMKKGDVSVTWIAKITPFTNTGSGSISNLTDYFWVTVPTMLGSLQAGTMREGFMNAMGAHGQDASPFLAAALIKGNGVALTTTVVPGLDSLKLLWLGNVFPLDSDGTGNSGVQGTNKATLGALAKMSIPMFKLQFGGFFNNNAVTGGKNGISLSGEAQTSMAGANIIGQVFWDLSDDCPGAAVSNTYGVAKARQLVNVYADFLIPMTAVTVYGNYVTDLNKSMTTTSGYQNLLMVGGKLALAPESALFCEYTNKTDGTGANATMMQAGIDWDL